MNIEEFDFHLPEELIAQTPLKDRSSSRMLVLNRKSKEMEHKQFTDIKSYLRKGDCLVLNDTRVLPARLYGTKVDTGAKVEVLLLHRIEGDEWEVLIKPAKKVKVGTELTFGDGKLTAICKDIKEHGGRILEFSYEGIFYEILDELGEMTLPPYIQEQLPEQERYQTVYAKEKGSAAAPTAGLHFTKQLLEEIRELGVNIVFITLHVGLGTFRPVSAEKIEEHKMHSEFFHMSKGAADTLTKAKENNQRIIAVGTTSTRTLETIAQENNGVFTESSGWTDIFIYPSYEFKAIDGLVTNFHLPKSSLIMLVSALAGRETILSAYKQAVHKRYRF